jgi:DNA-directed RNA polymerase beta subunit
LSGEAHGVCFREEVIRADSVIYNLPNLIEAQLDSFHRLKNETLIDLFSEISRLSLITGNEVIFPSDAPEAEGLKYWFGEPSILLMNVLKETLRILPIVFSVLLAGPEFPNPSNRISFWVISRDDGQGSFIINGTERWLYLNDRSPGVYFEARLTARRDTAWRWRS